MLVSMTGARIAVVVGQFEDIVSRGLRAMLEGDPSLELVATGIADEQFGAAMSVYKPSVAILNFGSLRNGAQLRELHEQFPDTQLLVLANHPTLAECRQMLALGATGCLSKSAEERDLLNAIHFASRGLRILPPDDSTQDGRSNGEIAAALHVGIETVRTHARHIYRKLGVRTRRELRARR